MSLYSDKKRIAKDLSFIIKGFVEPFLHEHGFVLMKKTPFFYEFRHKDNFKKKIYYELNSFNTGLEIRVSRGKGILGSYQLTDFLNGPEDFAGMVRTADWYFENKEQLLGLFEKQHELLKHWVFDWIMEKTDVDVDTIYEARTKKLENSQGFQNKAGATLKEWRETRFYPKNWKWKE
jgi:hypothetical protein